MHISVNIFVTASPKYLFRSFPEAEQELNKESSQILIKKCIVEMCRVLHPSKLIKYYQCLLGIPKSVKESVLHTLLEQNSWLLM